MPQSGERRIGVKFQSSVRKANAIARRIEEILADELDDYEIRTDGFHPAGWEASEVSVSFRGERSEQAPRKPGSRP